MEPKEACDGCGGPISYVDTAYVCAQDCTWCPECAESFGMMCPNCSEGLRRRHSRTRAVG